MTAREEIEQLKSQLSQIQHKVLASDFFLFLLLSVLFLLPSCNQLKHQAPVSKQITLPDSTVIQAAEKFRGESPYRDGLIARLEKHTTLDSEYLALVFRLANDAPANLAYPANVLGRKLFEDATLLNKSRFMSRGMGILANDYLALQQNDSALYYFEKDAENSAANKDYTMEGYANHQIGIIFSGLGEYKEAINFQLNAIRYQEKNIRPDHEFVQIRIEDEYDAIRMLASDYIETRDFINAQQWSRKAYQYYKDSRDTTDMLTSLSILGVAKRGLNEWDSAAYYSGLFLKIAKAYNPQYNLAGALDEFARIEYHKGNFMKSLDYEEQGFSEAQRAGYIIHERDFAKYLSMLYERSGDLKKALLYKTMAEQFSDSILQQRNTVQVLAMQNKFYFQQQMLAAQKENDLKQLAAADQLNAQRWQKYLFATGSVLLLLLSLFIYRNFANQRDAKNRIAKEEQRSTDLLHNILPEEVAAELKEKGKAGARLFDDVTVMFTDFKGFTLISEQLTPQQLVDELDACFSAFDKIITKHNIEKIKTVGDAYLAVSGLPLPSSNHAENLVKAAIEIREFMLCRRKELAEKTFEIRIGVHSGSVVAGIVGLKKFAYDIWGDSVNIAARMEQNSEAGKINISQTTYELVKNKFTCEYRGEIEAKNKGLLRMYFIN